MLVLVGVRSAYEQSIFCQVFHAEESGWRECSSCDKVKLKLTVNLNVVFALKHVLILCVFFLLSASSLWMHRF